MSNGGHSNGGMMMKGALETRASLSPRARVYGAATLQQLNGYKLRDLFTAQASRRGESRDDVVAAASNSLYSPRAPSLLSAREFASFMAASSAEAPFFAAIQSATSPAPVPTTATATATATPSTAPTATNTGANGTDASSNAPNDSNTTNASGNAASIGVAATVGAAPNTTPQQPQQQQQLNGHIAGASWPFPKTGGDRQRDGHGRPIPNAPAAARGLPIVMPSTSLTPSYIHDIRATDSYLQQLWFDNRNRDAANDRLRSQTRRLVSDYAARLARFDEEVQRRHEAMTYAAQLESMAPHTAKPSTTNSNNDHNNNTGESKDGTDNNGNDNDNDNDNDGARRLPFTHRNTDSHNHHNHNDMTDQLPPGVSRSTGVGADMSSANYRASVAGCPFPIAFARSPYGPASSLPVTATGAPLPSSAGGTGGTAQVMLMAPRPNTSHGSTNNGVSLQPLPYHADASIADAWTVPQSDVMTRVTPQVTFSNDEQKQAYDAHRSLMTDEEKDAEDARGVQVSKTGAPLLNERLQWTMNPVEEKVSMTRSPIIPAATATSAGRRRTTNRSTGDRPRTMSSMKTPVRNGSPVRVSANIGSQSARRSNSLVKPLPPTVERQPMSARSPLSRVGHHSHAATALAAIQLSSLSSLYRDEPDDEDDAEEDRLLLEQRTQLAARRRAHEREMASNGTTHAMAAARDVLTNAGVTSVNGTTASSSSTIPPLPIGSINGGSGNGRLGSSQGRLLTGGSRNGGRLVRREVRIAEAMAAAAAQEKEIAIWMAEEQQLERRVRERADEKEARRAKKLVRQIEYVSLSPYRRAGQPIFQQLPADHFQSLREIHQQALASRPSPMASITRAAAAAATPSHHHNSNDMGIFQSSSSLPEGAFISPPRVPAPIMTSSSARPLTSPLRHHHHHHHNSSPSPTSVGHDSNDASSTPMNHGSGSLGDCEFIQRRLSAANFTIAKGALERALLPPSTQSTSGTNASSSAAASSMGVRDQQFPAPFAAVPLNPFHASLPNTRASRRSGRRRRVRTAGHARSRSGARARNMIHGPYVSSDYTRATASSSGHISAPLSPAIDSSASSSPAAPRSPATHGFVPTITTSSAMAARGVTARGATVSRGWRTAMHLVPASPAPAATTTTTTTAAAEATSAPSPSLSISSSIHNSNNASIDIATGGAASSSSVPPVAAVTPVPAPAPVVVATAAPLVSIVTTPPLPVPPLPLASILATNHVEVSLPPASTTAISQPMITSS